MEEEPEKGLGIQIKYWQILEDFEKLTENLIDLVFNSMVTGVIWKRRETIRQSIPFICIIQQLSELNLIWALNNFQNKYLQSFSFILSAVYFSLI